MPEEDIILSRRIARGDHSAFHEAYVRFADDLYALSYAILGDRDGAAGVVQEVFVKLWENRNRILVSLSLGGYLYTATRHMSLNALRTAQRERKGLEGYALANADPDTLEDKVELDHRLDMLDKAICELSPQQCNVVRQNCRDCLTSRLQRSCSCRSRP